MTEEEETATGSTPARREAKSNCKRAWETGEAPSRDVTGEGSRAVASSLGRRSE